MTMTQQQQHGSSVPVAEVGSNIHNNLRHLLSSKVIDRKALEKICFKGIPDETRLRPLCWRVLLNYLPNSTSRWPEYLETSRSSYRTLVTELIVKWQEIKISGAGGQDHPLCRDPNSMWYQYFKDNETLLQINKDVRRLCPEISFFQQATEFPFRSDDQQPASLGRRISTELLTAENLTQNRAGMNNLVRVSKKHAEEEYKELLDGQEAHWQVVERILFLYYKVNPGVQYVQGMNEILGPIYYVFASDPDVKWREYAEVDSFYCFQYLMSEIQDCFIRTMDNSIFGIDFQMRRLYNMLSRIDRTLYFHLAETLEIMPEYFAFRWLSLLLSQEFLLPDVIRIWDSLFADHRRFEFLSYVCLAMLIHQRDTLLHNDFSANMRHLQNYVVPDIGEILALADYLRNRLETGKTSD